MRGQYKITGFLNDHNKKKYMQVKDFIVNLTVDKLGATLSIGDDETGIQYTIPIDGILREIKRANR